MRKSYFYDLEFIEDGRTIDPISIGIVDADARSGREYYAVFTETDMDRVKSHPWLARNVLPHLPLNSRGALTRYLAGEGHSRADLLGPVDLDRTDAVVGPRWRIAQEVREFLTAGVAEGARVELWGDYCAYDHVALAQLFGPMVDLPEGLPMFTRDVQDLAAFLGVDGSYLPEPAEGEGHNALADARNVRDRWLFLRHIDAQRRREAAPEARAAAAAPATEDNP